MAVPTFNRKFRVLADWTLAMFLKRDVVALGALENPREEFYEAAAPVTAAAAAKAKEALQPAQPAQAAAEKAKAS
jgi:NADH dehydrogenase